MSASPTALAPEESDALPPELQMETTEGAIATDDREAAVEDDDEERAPTPFPRMDLQAMQAADDQLDKENTGCCMACVVM